MAHSDCIAALTIAPRGEDIDSRQTRWYTCTYCTAWVSQGASCRGTSHQIAQLAVQVLAQVFAEINSQWHSFVIISLRLSCMKCLNDFIASE